LTKMERAGMKGNRGNFHCVGTKSCAQHTAPCEGLCGRSAAVCEGHLADENAHGAGSGHEADGHRNEVAFGLVLQLALGHWGDGIVGVVIAVVGVPVTVPAAEGRAGHTHRLLRSKGRESKA
jgi:hypothetical protein